MINKVKVLCKAQMKDFIENDLFGYIKNNKVAVISIIDTDSPDLFGPDISNENVLTLHFDDITPKMAIQFNSDQDSERKIRAMSFKQGSEIINFINSKQEYESNFELFVHCSAGISRSGAVGLFVNQYLNLDESEFYSNNPQILPNYWVENVLWNVVS